MVSIITINYNSFDATLRLIKSLETAVLPEFELIIVDNNSKEDKKRLETYDFPSWVTLVYSSKNLGFAGGNNLGFKYAKYEYIMVLNNDTVIKDDFLTPLIQKLTNSEKTGLVCSKIYDLERPNIIQFGGYAPLGRYMIDIKSLYHGCEDNCGLSFDTPTPFAHGAAMMFKKNTLKLVGEMPEVYFLYFEELDWSLSFKKAGFDIICVNNSRVYHEGSHSTSKISSLKIYYNIRNRLIFAKRNLTGLNRAVNLSFQLFVSCPKHIIKKPKQAKVIIKAIFDFLLKKH